jgi:2'-5' RNA ligase
VTTFTSTTAGRPGSAAPFTYGGPPLRASEQVQGWWRGWSVNVGGVALAVCLLFDRRSERAVRALWDRLEGAGVPTLRSHTHGRHVPHVSYAVLRTWDPVAVSAAVAGLGAVAPVELTFDGIGLFRRGRAWLLAAATAEFLTRQERLVDAVTATGAELHKHYRPGRWLPHCSVAPRTPLAQLPVLVAAIYDVLPLEARLDRVALVDSATGELWPVSAPP